MRGEWLRPLMRLDDAYRILELDARATDDAVREAYRDLTKVWHPDRFGNDASMRAKAEEKLKQINEAYQTIRSARDGRTGRRRERPDPDPTEPGSTSAEWRVRTAAGEGTVPDFAALVAHVLHGRIDQRAEVFHPELGHWVPLLDIPELRDAFTRGRSVRRRGWAIACVALGALILLRRPSLGGLIIAAALIAIAVVLMMGSRERDGADRG